MLAAAAPRQAPALEPGVHVDPGSPAAKEYAFPLSSARNISGGSRGATPGGQPTGPQLFGAGITPSPSRGRLTGPSPRPTRKTTRHSKFATGALGPSKSAAGAPGLPANVLGEVRRLTSPSSDPLSGTVIALAVAVLGAGGLGALALRRLHDRDERLTGS